MKAAVLLAPRQPLEIADVTLDKPASREVLVRIAASGLCHSDYHYMSGDLPMPTPCVLGHEAAGIVEAVGEGVTAVNVGDHVVSCISVFCGHCNNCVSGRTHLCSDKPRRARSAVPRMMMGAQKLFQAGELGAFAEQMLVHENALVRVPRELPLDRAALLGCGVLTGLGAVFNAAKVTPGSRVVVVGCGGVGLNVVQGARIAGASRIIAIDLMVEKRELALKFGATDVLDGGEDAVKAVRQLSAGGVDFAFEVIGLPHTVEQAIRMLAPGGLMTIVGAMRFDATVALPGFAALLNEWRVQGSFMGSSPFTRDIPRYAAMYLKGELELDTLIAERIALAEINRGFDTLLRATQARSVITFPDIMQEAARRA